MRFYSAVVDADRAPSVGDDVAVARYANTTPGSSPITAKATAVHWTDLLFTSAIVHLHTDNYAVSGATLVDPERWTDEDPE